MLRRWYRVRGRLPAALVRIVRACLVAFHGWSEARATSAVADLTVSLAQADTGVREMFFHGSEFGVACGLACREPPIAPHRDAYNAMRDRLYGPLES